MVDYRPEDQPLAPGERIEKHEITERVPAGSTPPPVSGTASRGSPMWMFILPLIVLVFFLAWFIFTRGEPEAPLSDVDAVEIEVPDVDIDVDQ